VPSVTVEELSSIIVLVRMQSRWWRRENFDGAAAGGEQRAAQQLLSAGGGAVKIFSAPPEPSCPGQSDDARQLFRRHRGHLPDRVLRYGPVPAEATFSSCSPAVGRDVPFCILLLARPGGLAALAFKCGNMPSTPTILEVLEPPPAACESAAAHAARRCLPRIVTANAASYPPPSLNNFRTAAARAPADSAPALWYWQLTGEEWQRDGHSYELAKKAWRRMPAEHKAAERERDRSGRKRPADDGAKAAQRSRVKREAETLEATAAYRVVDTHAFISADGHVHLLVAPSEVRASRLEPETPCVPYLYSISVRSLATAGHLPRPRVLPSS
jgi:hypothetical protein